MSNQKLSISKPIISINELCQKIQLSRSRYYQLVQSKFFPEPKIDPRSNRPYFDAELQEQIFKSRETGIGADGSYLLFYSPRKKVEKRVISKKRKKTDSFLQDITDTLQNMGLDCDEEDVSAAISELYPDGTKGTDKGLIIREIFRFLKSK